MIKNAIKNLPYLRDVVRERDALRTEAASLLAHKLLLEEEALQLHKENASLAAENSLLQTATETQTGTWMPPGHFYSPITSPEEIKLKEAEIWKQPMPDRVIAGVELNEEEQMKLWGEFTGYYREQPWAATRQEGLRYFFENENYSYSDALFLYCMLRHLRPRRLIEVGSGYSSCVTLDTNELFFDNTIDCTFIEPHPALLFSLIKDEDRSRIKVMPGRVQDVSLDLFAQLEEGDVLFIDSTHVAKTASDVNHLFFNILPRLKSGVHIHFHDIFYPFVYPKEWEYEGRSWNETYLLRAFLQYNSDFRVYLYGGFLQYFHYDEFMKDMPLSMIRNAASLWIKKVR